MCLETGVLVTTIVELGPKTVTTTVPVPNSSDFAGAARALETAIKYSPPTPKSMLVTSVSLICPKCAEVVVSYTLCWKVETGKGSPEWAEEFTTLETTLKAVLRTA